MGAKARGQEKCAFTAYFLTSGKVAYGEAVPLDNHGSLVQRLGSDDRGTGIRFTAGKVAGLPLGPIH